MLQRNLYRSLKQTVGQPIRRYYARWAYREDVPLAWCVETNWGDALNPILVSMLSGRRVRPLLDDYYDRYIAIGSILWMANGRTEVWGSGLIDGAGVPKEHPKKIHAVRGPLTREALLGAGIDCPEVYGDPALLLPGFFDPQVPVEFEVGIIPHYVDKKNAWIERNRSKPGIRIIDVQSDIWEFVEAVKSCKSIMSSSLHGLVCADSYGIPNLWIKLSEGVRGSGFKFRDYRLSIGAPDFGPVEINPDAQPLELASMARFHGVNLDLRALLLACPFLSESLRARAEVLDGSIETLSLALVEERESGGSSDLND